MRHLWTALTCVVVGLAAHQQTPPVFRTATQFVAVDVVVTGKGDAPVTDLTRDDFEIRENGKLQRISDFAFVSIPLANGVVDIDAPPQPPGDVASNATSARASRALVILVDDSSLSAALVDPNNPSNVLVDMKKALTTFLQTLSSDDQVAIIWQSRSDVSQDFTNDIPRLITAVNNRHTAMGMTPLGPSWRPRVESLTFAVAALAGSHYARRAIVFVGTTACNAADTGSGFEAQECQDLMKRAKQANVPIYTLDPRVNPPSGSHTMAELAINTGGRAFTLQSNPSAAVRQIMVENGSFYTLGFYPEPLVNDGKYHDIQVTVKRPGVSVRSRDRYLADTATRPPSTPTRDMTAALGGGLDDPSLPIRLSVTPLAAGPGGTRTLVTVELAYPGPDGDLQSFDDELRVGIPALTPGREDQSVAAVAGEFQGCVEVDRTRHIDAEQHHRPAVRATDDSCRCHEQSAREDGHDPPYAECSELRRQRAANQSTADRHVRNGRTHRRGDWSRHNSSAGAISAEQRSRIHSRRYLARLRSRLLAGRRHDGRCHGRDRGRRITRPSSRDTPG